MSKKKGKISKNLGLYEEWRNMLLVYMRIPMALYIPLYQTHTAPRAGGGGGGPGSSCNLSHPAGGLLMFPPLLCPPPPSLGEARLGGDVIIFINNTFVVKNQFITFTIFAIKPCEPNEH